MTAKNILIVEDEVDPNTLYQMSLQAEGFSTVGVFSGEEALEALGREPFDLVLLDIMMKGGIDGIETCRRIRENPAWAQLPVCMITASVDIEKVVSSFKAGANGYIVKPFDMQELFNKIAELTGATPSTSA